MGKLCGVQLVYKDWNIFLTVNEYGFELPGESDDLLENLLPENIENINQGELPLGQGHRNGYNLIDI